MKMFLISDNTDTLTGLRLVGVDGTIVNGENEFMEALDRAVNDESIAILIIVEKLGRKYSEAVNAIRFAHKMPLVVEIPDRHGSARIENFITEYVREAIGIVI